MKKILIDGMTCSKCTTAIENRLKTLEGIGVFKIVLENNEAFISGNITDDILKEAVESEGFTVVEIKKLNNINTPRQTTLKKKDFFTKLIDKIGNSNKSTFGKGHLDCCDLNKENK